MVLTYLVHSQTYFFLNFGMKLLRRAEFSLEDGLQQNGQENYWAVESEAESRKEKMNGSKWKKILTNKKTPQNKTWLELDVRTTFISPSLVFALGCVRYFCPRISIDREDSFRQKNIQ